MIHAQITDTIVMVRPTDFGWNEQTARDNEFQHRPKDNVETREKALAEFACAVTTLESVGIRVLVLEPDASLPPLPDAVFPNNWFSVWPDGRVFLYPMRTVNRQAEVRPQALQQLLNGVAAYPHLHRIAAAPGLALEGTGALVFDHDNKVVYAARSERCDGLLAAEHARELGYTLCAFDTASRAGRVFYHTNVVMSVGERFVLLAQDVIVDNTDRQTLLAQITRSGKELITLDSVQTETAFCANSLQLKSRDGERLIVLSSTAYRGLTDKQREQLSRHGRLLPLDIPHIEQVGGGSARCMLAEVFY